MHLYLTPVDVIPIAITTTPTPTAFASNASVAITPAHVTAGINNGSESDRSDGILEIIYMGRPPAATVTIIYLCEKMHNTLLQAQGYLQEDVEVAGSPNTVSAT